MEKTINELRGIISLFTPKISAINSPEFNAKPNPVKWSKKEVLGHLIDSAQNNLRRFVVGQYESEPHIIYDQDFWVTAADYQNMSDQDIITLWRLINERICVILEKMPSENYNHQANTGKMNPSFHTLSWLASDYVKHMKHHFNQILPGSFDITYP